MKTVQEMLEASSAFKTVAKSDLQSTASQWTVKHIAGDRVLWNMGDVADEMALVIKGELVAVVDDVEVGRIGVGEMVGEATIFIQDSFRSATLKSTRFTEVLTLSFSALVDLWQKRSPVYSVLLDQALATLTRRVRTCNRELARLALGSGPAPAHTEPGLLARMWKALRPGGPQSPQPSLEHLLKAQMALKHCHSEEIQALMSAFVPVPFEEGQILFLEGESADGCYLLGEGEIDVLRHVRGNKAQLLAKLTPDDQFGMNCLIDRGKRSASCVANTPGWLFKMSSESFDKLSGEPRLLWRENMLVGLVAQLKNANRILYSVTKQDENGGKEVDIDEVAFRDVLKASGFLEGAQRTQNLDQIRVVFSDEQKRNSHNNN